MSYNTMYKAAEKFAWHCADKYIDSKVESRRSLAGANTFHHPDDGPYVVRQVICDGFVMVTYDVPFEGLPKAPVNDFPFATFLRASRGAMRGYGFRVGKLPDYKQVKRLWAEEKRRCSGHPQDRNCRYCLARESTHYLSVFVDIQKLIEFMELTDSKGGEAIYYSGPMNPIYMEVWREYRQPNIGLAIEGALLPMRVVEGAAVLNLQKEG